MYKKTDQENIDKGFSATCNKDTWRTVGDNCPKVSKEKVKVVLSKNSWLKHIDVRWSTTVSLNIWL